MKYLLTLIVVSLLLTGCGRRDARLQQALTGTWVVDLGNNIRSVNIIGANTGFAAQVTGFTNGSVVRIEGTFRVRNGELIETVTKDSQPNEKVPFVVRGHIIHLDDRELVARWDTKPYSVVVVARKIKR